MYRNFFKRLIDLLTAAVGLIILSPLFLVVCLCLIFANSGKVFFCQARPGKNSKIFKVIKFKTMNDKTDIDGNLLPDVERMTVIGQLIRKTSLDEIPQLINVLKGDMALIGPRPLLVEYLPLYDNQQIRRHDVRPGITGWAQINGRNAISWAEKFRFDVWYVDHLSFCLDLQILCKTVIKVFKSEGINSSSSVTMEKFTGNS
ncbi:MAG: sugar transferase [Dysgonamonadaceae bacterium]|jgi:lipopolysaccharide/colanic/teichoic acid biosynthesis glycosyltransferase|nr:sugar transferase [Dysgonamonadaceae bacterium]